MYSDSSCDKKLGLNGLGGFDVDLDAGKNVRLTK